MPTITIPLAALAGVVSFASPCFLPVVPVFVSYLVGGRTDTPAALRRSEALRQSLCFVAGFTAVFVIVWSAIGLIGYAAGDYRDLLRVGGGVVLVVMGLHVARLIDVPVLHRTARVPVGVTVGGPGSPAPDELAPSPRRSVLMGVAFGAGWTPCIGPVLGGIIGLASLSDSVGRGAVLLLVYAAGLGIPFVLVALGATAVSRRLAWLARHEAAVSLVSGALLIVTGFLMITNLLGRLSGLVPALGL